MNPSELISALRKWLGEGGDASPMPPAFDEIAGIKEGMKEIRELLRRFGAALGAGAAAVLTGLGYTQIHEIFPLPVNSDVRNLEALAAASAVAALLGAAWLAGRFFSAQRRIVISSEQHRRSAKLRRAERRLRDEIFDAAAAEFSAGSLEALELRGVRLRRLARRLPADDAAKAVCADEATKIEDYVPLVLYRAALRILEWRAHQAFRGKLTALATLMTIAGVIGLFGIADWSQGQRELIALRKECAAAVEAGAKTACSPVLSKSTIQTAADEDAQAAKEAAAELAAARARLGQGASAVDRAADCRLVIEADDTLKDADERAQEAALGACMQATA